MPSECLDPVTVTSRFWNVVDELSQTAAGRLGVDLRRCNRDVAEEVTEAHEVGIEFESVNAELVSE